ncbi:transposase [Dysgonomonadaceae bacterium PH5-43]|nr:transposase [Dysgonomonadaceae bacterium PH5-43]
MVKELKISQKKELAKYIFLTEKGITQKELAKKAEISLVTANKWVKEWEHLRLNLLQTREERHISTLVQLSKLDEEIAKVGYPDSKQADIRRKLTADLEALEQEASIRDVAEVGKRLLSWLRPINTDHASLVGAIINEFIKHLLSGK